MKGMATEEGKTTSVQMEFHLRNLRQRYVSGLTIKID